MRPEVRTTGISEKGEGRWGPQGSSLSLAFWAAERRSHNKGGSHPKGNRQWGRGHEAGRWRVGGRWNEEMKEIPAAGTEGGKASQPGGPFPRGHLAELSIYKLRAASIQFWQ